MKTVALIFTSETFLSNPASESCECTCMHDIFKTNKYYIIILPLHITWPKCFCLFVCSCVRLLPLIRCKLRQILVTHDHWAVRVLYGTGYPFYMVISEEPWPWNTLLAERLAMELYRLGSVATGDRTQISCMQGERSTNWTIADVHVHICYDKP